MGGWVGGWMEGEETVGMSYCGVGLGGWVGGWFEWVDGCTADKPFHPPTHKVQQQLIPTASFSSSCLS